jgi:hypothetical protein
MRAAKRLDDRRIMEEVTMLCDLFAELGAPGSHELVDQVERDTIDGEEVLQDVRKIAEIVKLVGVRVAEEWR